MKATECADKLNEEPAGLMFYYLFIQQPDRNIKQLASVVSKELRCILKAPPEGTALPSCIPPSCMGTNKTLSLIGRIRTFTVILKWWAGILLIYS